MSRKYDNLTENYEEIDIKIQFFEILPYEVRKANKNPNGNSNNTSSNHHNYHASSSSADHLRRNNIYNNTKNNNFN